MEADNEIIHISLYYKCIDGGRVVWRLHRPAYGMRELDALLDLSRQCYGEIWLHPGNDDYPSFCITPDDELTIWGVVAKVIKNFR